MVFKTLLKCQVWQESIFSTQLTSSCFWPILQIPSSSCTLLCNISLSCGQQTIPHLVFNKLFLTWFSSLASVSPPHLLLHRQVSLVACNNISDDHGYDDDHNDQIMVVMMIRMVMIVVVFQVVFFALPEITPQSRCCIFDNHNNDDDWWWWWSCLCPTSPHGQILQEEVEMQSPRLTWKVEYEYGGWRIFARSRKRTKEREIWAW